MLHCSLTRNGLVIAAKEPLLGSQLKLEPYMSLQGVFCSHYIIVNLRTYWHAPFDFLWCDVRLDHLIDWMMNEKRTLSVSLSVGRVLYRTSGLIEFQDPWFININKFASGFVNKQAFGWFYLSFDAPSVLAKATCHSDSWPETPEAMAALQFRLQDAMTVLPSERVVRQTAIKLVWGTS